MRGERLRQAKKRARRVLRALRGQSPKSTDFFDDDGLFAKQLRFTRRYCSCEYCKRLQGYRLTVQERKADEQMRAELEDM